jgi:asparagine synthase (glutamine-hydrolysing)
MTTTGSKTREAGRNVCGLAGVARFGTGNVAEPLDRVLKAMTAAVAHRGPDEQVIRCEGQVGFGFGRLALVAPDAGDQPLYTPDRQVVLIANGEVYNHRELARGLASGAMMRTGSDCEVLGHLYQEHGRDFLHRVHGMFAIILLDVRRRRLVLARDRFGIKPLYFHRNAERIAVASEIKALFADPQTPRVLDWAGALASPTVQSAPALVLATPTSFFAGIEYVEPGTVMEIDLADGRTATYRYWEFPGTRPELPSSDADVVQEYGRLLAESVADCAESDAELGLLLSGGVDSASVAVLAAKSRPIHTFSVLNPATIESGDAYYADVVARHAGLPNHQMYVPADHCPTVEEWLRFLWLMEHPMAGAEAYLKHELYRYARNARPGLKGMLLGAASDEFNGGYSGDIAGGGGWAAFLANLAVMARRADARGDTVAGAWNETLGFPVLRTARRDGYGDDYLRYLGNEYRKVYQYNVWHEDRSAAGSGVEARVPFLDHRLVEFVTAIPPARREILLWDKRILRDAVRDILPDEIAHREKVPFVHGAGVRHTQRMLLRLLTRDDRELLRLATRGPGAAEFLDAGAMHSMVDAMTGGASAEGVDLLLRVVNLGALESMLAELPPPMVDRPAPPVLQAWPDAVFDGEPGRRLVETVLARPEIADDDVVAWVDGAQAVDSLDGSGTRFLVRDGVFEFMVDAETPGWHAFVGEIDGVRTVGDLSRHAGVTSVEIAEYLHQAVEGGLLSVIQVTGEGLPRQGA